MKRNDGEDSFHPQREKHAYFSFPNKDSPYESEICNVDPHGLDGSYPKSVVSKSVIYECVGYRPRDMEVFNIGKVVKVCCEYGYSFSRAQEEFLENLFPFKIFIWSEWKEETRYKTSFAIYKNTLEEISKMPLELRLTDPREWVRQMKSV